MRVSLDTNVFLGVKNRESSYRSSVYILDSIDSGVLRCVVSTVTIAEICTGYYLAGEMEEKDDFLTHLEASQNYEIIDVSTAVADAAGRVRASTGLRLPDAIVVASALAGKAERLISNDESMIRAAKLIKIASSLEFEKEDKEARADVEKKKGG